MCQARGMRYIIIGAGAIGATIGGRLAEAGLDVVLVARGAHAQALAADGLRLTTAGGERVHRLPVVTGPAELGELRPDDVLLLTVKTQDAIAALDAWGDAEVAGGGTAAQRLPVLCLQNGVESERLALRRFARVYGVCVWLPATFLEPGVVSALCAPLTGILHLGRAAGGSDARARAIAADLEKAGFGAPVVEDVMRWKYAKLLGNLGNAIQATTGPEPDPAKAALLLRAIREGKAAFAAAGIGYASDAEQSAARDGKVEQPHGGAGRVVVAEPGARDGVGGGGLPQRGDLPAGSAARGGDAGQRDAAARGEHLRAGGVAAGGDGGPGPDGPGRRGGCPGVAAGCRVPVPVRGGRCAGLLPDPPFLRSPGLRPGPVRGLRARALKRRAGWGAPGRAGAFRPTGPGPGPGSGRPRRSAGGGGGPVREPRRGRGTRGPRPRPPRPPRCGPGGGRGR